MTQWIDITPSPRRTTKKTEEDTTNWVDITPSTYKPPEHPFTGPEEPTTLDKMKVSAGHLWDKTGGVALRTIGAGLEPLPPFRTTPQMQKAMEEFNAEYPISGIPGKMLYGAAQFGTSPIGIAGILSEGAIPALAGLGEAGSLTRNVGTIASQFGKGLHEIGGAGLGITGAKHAFDASIDPNLNNWQKAGGITEGLAELMMGKMGAGVYREAPAGLKKVGDANVPPPPGGPSTPSVSLPESPLNPQRSFDFGQPEPHLPFHGEPSMEVPVPFEHRWQVQPDYGLMTSIPGQPRTEMQTPRAIEGPEVGPYGTGVGQERLPLQDEFGQGELGLPLTHPEENPSRMPYVRPEPIPTPKAEGETVAPDATQQPHVISARGMTKADIEMLRTQGYESGGQGPDNYAQMIRKAGPPPSASTTPVAPNVPPVASGATTVDVRAGQPLRVPKDALTTQVIERLKAQGFEKTGNDVNGDGLFTRIIKETGGWGDDAAIGDFFRDFFGREPSIEEMADMAVPGDGRKGLFMKIMGTIHDTRDSNTLRRQAEILDEQKGIAINNGEVDAAANLADLHREALESADRLSTQQDNLNRNVPEGAPPGSLPGQRPPQGQMHVWSDTALQRAGGKWDVFDPSDGRTIQTFNSEHEALIFIGDRTHLDYEPHDPTQPKHPSDISGTPGGFQVNSIPGGQPHGPMSDRSITDLSNQINELAIPGTTAPDGLRQQLDSQLYDKLRFERDPEIAKQNLKEVSDLRRTAATEGDIERAAFNLGVAQDTVEITSGRWDGISAREDYLHEIAEQIRGNETPESYHHQRYDSNQLVEDARRIIESETDPARMKDNWDQLRAILDNMNRRRESYETRDVIRQLSDAALAKWSQSRPDAMHEAASRMKYREEDPRVPPDTGFTDALDSLHGQLEAGYDVNEEILGEIQDRISNAKDIKEAMDMRSELGSYVDNVGDPIMRDLYERLWQQADKKYYELVRNDQAPLPPSPPVRSRQIYEIAEDLRNKLTEGDENGIEALLSEAENTITNETDPAIIQDNFDQLEGYLDQARLHGTPDDIEFLGQLRDTALDKLRKGLDDISSAPPQYRNLQPDYHATGGPNFQASDFPTPKDAMEARQFEIERRYQNFGEARDKYKLPNGRIISVDATATKGIDSFDFGGQEAKYVGPMGPEDTIDPATGNVIQLDPSGRPKTEPPAGAEAVPPSGEIEDLRQQNGLEGITGPSTDESVDLGQTPTLRDFIRDTSGEERNDELGRRIGIPEARTPIIKPGMDRPDIEYEQARIQATTSPVFIERMTREYMGERRIAIREKDWDRVHELDKQISQLADQRDMVYSKIYPDTPLSPRELEQRGQQQLPGMAATMDSGQPLADVPSQSPMGIPEQRPPTQGQLPMSRRPKIGRIPGLTIDKIKEAEASLSPTDWDPGLDHEWGKRQLDGFTPQKGQPGLSVADVNGDTAIGNHDIGQIVYRNPQGTRALVVARVEPKLDGSGKMGVKSFYSDKDAGIAQGRGVVAVLKKLVEIDALRVNGPYSSWTRDVINGLRDFIDDTGGWGDDSQLWENIKRRTGWGQGGKTQPPKLDAQGQPVKELNLLKELISFPGSANTTGDLSASGRQALPFIFTPEFWKAQGPQLRAGWSKDAFDRINAQLEDLPLFRQRLDLTTGDLKPSLANELGMKLLKASDHIDEREAAIASRWLETGGNIPGFSKVYGATIGRYVRGSNRAYMTLLNHIRANRTQKLFDLSRDMSVQALETGSARPGFFKQKYSAQEALDLDPYTNKVLGKEIVDFVNTATGRGPLKMHILPYRKSEVSFEGSADKLGYLLFAPRMIASRMRMLNPSTYIMASPFVRKQYLKAALSTAAAWMAMNQMGKIAGAETNDDLDSADFGKMKFGDMRLDPAGGFQQFLVAYHRLYTGGYTSSSTGQWHQFGKGFQAQTQYDAGERLFSNKLNPVAKFAWDVLNASEYQPFHVYDRTAQLFVPLIIQDVYELAKEDPSLLPLVAPIAFGMGTQIYSKGESVGKFIQPEDDWLSTGGGLQDLLPEGWQQQR